MNITTIEQKLDANVYGEQSIVSDDLAAFLWTGYKTYVLGKKQDMLFVDRMVSGANVVISEAESSYDEEVDFPNISYIPKTFEYDFANQVNLVNSYKLSGNKTNVASILVLEAVETSPIPSGRFRVDIEISDTINSWYFVAVVEILDNILSDNLKDIKIYPRSTTTTGINTKLYDTDNKTPLFYDASDNVENITRLNVILPQSLGKIYTIKTTLTDFLNVNRSFSVSLLGSKIMWEEFVPLTTNEDLTQENLNTWVGGVEIGSTNDDYDGYELSDIGLSDFQDDITDSSIVGEEITSAFDPVLVEPTYSIYNLTDIEMDNLVTYLTMITNMTSDEAQNGMEQYEAANRFNSSLLSLPEQLFATTPEEFKKDMSGKRKGSMQSGTRLAGRIY